LPPGPDEVHYVCLLAVTNAVLRAAWRRGTADTTRSRIPRVAPTEPYRWGANLPAAPAAVKAGRHRRWRPATPRRPAIPGGAARTPARPGSSRWRGWRCRGRGQAGRPAPPAAAGCGAARRARAAGAGSCALDPDGALVRPPALPPRRPPRGRQALLGEVILHQPPPQIIARPLGNDLPGEQPGSRPDPAREEPQPQAQPRAVEERLHGAPQKRVELAHAPVLAPGVAEVFPRLEPRRHRLGGRHGHAFVHEQLAQRGAAAGLPVVVGAVEIGHQPPQLGAARRRGVTHRVRHLVRD